MKLIRDWWLPDTDTHFEDMFLRTKGTVRPFYQGAAQSLAIDLAEKSKRTGLMVDVGAHVGLWAWGLGSIFRRVCCFEPIQENRECLVRNAPRAEVYPYGLSSFTGGLRLSRPTAGNSGSWEAAAEGEKVKVRTLDEFGFTIDLLKIDVQGHEAEVLRGGEETILKHFPLIVVEGQSTRRLLEHWGYELVVTVGKDSIYAVSV